MKTKEVNTFGSVLKILKLKPRRIIFGSMFIVSMIFIMISVTLSWFVYSGDAKVNGLEIDVTLVDELLLDNNEQNKYVTFEGEFNSLGGNGKSFFLPKWTADKKDGHTVHGIRFDGYEPIDSIETLKKHAFVHDFSLSVQGSVNLTLGEGTVISSSDANAKRASRVAILEWVNGADGAEGKYQLKAIWIPDVTTATGEQEQKVTFVDADGTERDFDLNEYKDNESDIAYAWGELTKDNRLEIGTLASETKKYRFIIWLDGNDAECTNDLMGKDIAVTLKFMPVENANANGGEEQ